MKNLLLPIDFSLVTPLQIRSAVQQLDPGHCMIHLLHVLETSGDDGPLLPAEKKAALETLEAARSQLTSDLLGKHTTVDLLVRKGDPVYEINQAIQALDIDGVVMGSHGTGRLHDLVFGSVTAGVLRLAPVPVTIVPSPTNDETETMPPELKPQPFLVAIDFSHEGATLVKEAIRQARSKKAEVHVLHILKPALGENLISTDSWHRQEVRIETAREELTALCRVVRRDMQYSKQLVKLRVEIGEPADRIMRRAETIRPAVILIGSHGHGRLYDALLGSVTTEVVRQAPCQVMVFPFHAAAKPSTSELQPAAF